MNFYVDSGGVVLHVEPERIFQGSANANTIRFIGAFASTLPVLVAYKLPNGVWTVPAKMTAVAELSGVQTPEGIQFNTWEYQIPQVITENYGTVNIQFYVYGNVGGTGGQIATAMSSFVVEKGVPITLPDPGDPYETLLMQILAAISQLQGEIGVIDNNKLDKIIPTNDGDYAYTVNRTSNETDWTVTQGSILLTYEPIANSIAQRNSLGNIAVGEPSGARDATSKEFVTNAIDMMAEKKLDKSGGTITGSLAIMQNLTVYGTTKTENTETLNVESNMIVTNATGVDLLRLSGLGIRTDATNTYGIVYDPVNQSVKLGLGFLDEDNEFTFNPREGLAVTVRDDSSLLVNGHLLQWDAANYKLIDSGIAANNVMTTNTAQQISGQKSFSEPLHASNSGTSRYVSDYAGTYIATTDNAEDTTYTRNFPQKSGVFAMTSDVPTDYVTQAQLDQTNQNVEDLYTILEQAQVVTVTMLEQAYTTRETADGENIVDGVQTSVKQIQGKTVATANLIPYPYAETTKTQNGVTFTVSTDGSITVNGTATAKTVFFIVNTNKFIKLSLGVSYRLSGCPAGGSSDTFSLIVQDSAYSQTFYDFGNGDGGITRFTDYYAFITISAGYTANNLVFRPMLNIGTEAKPYSKWFAGLKNAYFEKIVSTGKNLVPYPYTESTLTRNGVTFTVNDDRSITVNGTATANTAFYILYKRESSTFVAGNTYHISGCPANGSYSTYFIQLSDDTVGSKSDYGEGVSYTLQSNNIRLSINIQEGTTVNNLIFRPMLNFGTSALPYEPYISDTLAAETPIELPEYDIAFPETGETKRNSKTVVFDGTEAWGDYSTEVSATYSCELPISAIDNVLSIINNLFPTAVNNGISLTNRVSGTLTKLLAVFSKTDYPNLDTLDKWKAYLASQSTAGNPLTVTYKTAEATTEATPFNKSKYIAWKNGSETIVQGPTDNSEYGAENTVKQDYFTLTGGTTNG